MNPDDPPQLVAPSHLDHEHVSGCVICGAANPFELPKAVVEAVLESRLVLFIGSGVSTEDGVSFPTTFLEEIRGELSEDLIDADFPTVMAAYESEHGRIKLIEQVMERLQFAETFPIVRQIATRFHSELAPIYPIRELITTNWDCFLEDECAALGIVVDGDYAFYNLPGRKVYKIHGSIRNVSTLVATTEDYTAASARFQTSAIGGTLRHLLATKIVVFVGYSLRDSDFQNVYGPLMQSMGALKPVSYFVSPFDSPEAQTMGLHHIKTDGTHFIRTLKERLIDDGALLPDSHCYRARLFHEITARAHTLTADMDWRGNPGILFSLAYQDGLLDSLRRIGSQWKTGEYAWTQKLHGFLHSYEHLLHVAVDRGRYWDAAYIDGYINGMLVLLVDESDLDAIPLYEYFEHKAFGIDFEQDAEDADKAPATPPDDEPEGGDEGGDEGGQSLDRFFVSESDLQEYFDDFTEVLPEAHAEAHKLFGHIGEGLVPQHSPYLDGVLD